MTIPDFTVEYRDIPGHPGYRAGSDGTIWSCWKKRGVAGKLNAGSVSYQSEQWSVRKPIVNRHGQLRVSLKAVVNGVPTTRGRFVSRLVLLAFVGPCPHGMEACHEDGNALDCRISNLRWDTHSNNIADKKRHGTHQEGVRHPLHKLTDEDVVKIRQDNRTLREIAAEYRVTEQNVWCIQKRKTWKHVA